MLILSICILLLIAFGGLISYRDVLSPVFLQPIIWLGALLALFIWSDNYYSVSGTALLLLCLSCLAFSVGAHLSIFFTKRYFYEPVKEKALDKFSIPKFVSRIIVGLSLGVFLLVLSRAFDLVGHEILEHAYIRLRYYMTAGRDEGGGYGVLSYGITFVFFSVYLMQVNAIKENTRESRLLLVLQITIAIAVAVLSTGRSFVVTVIQLVFFCRLVYNTTSVGRAFIFIFILTLVVYFGLGEILGKTGGKLDSYGGIGAYLVAPFVAFSMFLEAHNPTWTGEYTFRFLFSILNLFGFNFPQRDIIEKFSYTPEPTNLYTIFYNYYADFGVGFVLLMFYLLGSFHGFIYGLKISRPNSDFVKYIFVLSLFPLLSQLAQEAYVVSISIWIQYFIFGYIFLVLFRARSRHSN